MHNKLVEYVLKQKYNATDWGSLAKEISQRFAIPLDVVEEQRFVPGGRILAALNNPRKVSYVNCTTYTIEDDSIEGISRAVYHVMKASSRGQGIGVDISVLRPRGSYVDNAANSSSGSVSFMYPIEAAMSTIGQSGRRGALLFSIDGDHPDVLDFIKSKDNGDLSGANLSLKLSNDTASRIFADKPVPLKFNGKHYNEVHLLDVLAKSAWATGDPGLIFWERSQELSNSDACGKPIVGVNACSETRLAQNDVCVLGSMNLVAYVREPFTTQSHFDWELFGEDIGHAIRCLDEVITKELEENRSPYPEQSYILEQLRRLGLGFMGLADAILMMGWRYDSQEALKFATRVSKKLLRYSYEASIQLAQEKGPCPAWEDMVISAFPNRELLVNLGLWHQMVKHGMRNITTMAIAPTGTISILAGVSSGLEPIFAPKYQRNVKLGGKSQVLDIVHPILKTYTGKGLPPHFQEAHAVNPYARIAIQSVVQRYVDQSCSSTINLPHDTTVEDVKNIFRAAWEANLTGVTIFRDGCREEQVLNRLQERAKVLDGKTVKLNRKGNVYVTVNYWNDQPYEVFVNGLGTTPADTQMADGFARLSSHLLRYGMPVSKLVRELRQIRSSHINSVPIIVASALVALGDNCCPDCGNEYRVEEGCETCSCGVKCD